MAGINSLRGLRNINLTSVKETVKRTAALTLLLSTVACSQSARSDSFIIWAPLLCILGPSVVGAVIGGILEAIENKTKPNYDSVKGPFLHPDDPNNPPQH